MISLIYTERTPLDSGKKIITEALVNIFHVLATVRAHTDIPSSDIGMRPHYCCDVFWRII